MTEHLRTIIEWNVHRTLMGRRAPLSSAEADDLVEALKAEARDDVPALLCARCVLEVEDLDDAEDSITVLEGTALCEDHLP